jgi:NAD(P)-dependent dehydrogenase (short-subunit alcohol dehydrogenase family)
VDLDPCASFRLDDRVAIVTGASSGLGERFARVLDAAGARVVLVARRADRLDALAHQLRAAEPLVLDVTEPDAASVAVDFALAQYGRVDVLVNNAGTTQPCPALEETADDFRRVLEVNLVAPFLLAQRAAQAMISGGGGSIVNVASIWALVGVGDIPNGSYAASKAGLVGLTRELAAQWARHAVRVNALAPGWFESEMTRETMFHDEAGSKWMRRRTPLGRGGREEELDGALLFLASDASSFVTGTVLPVDGGWTAI